MLKKIIKELMPYILTILVVLLLRIFVILNVTIPSGSMISTINVGDRCMGLKCAYWFSQPERYDIIVFDAPDNPEVYYIKRVIGLPGETVEIKHGVTYVDGVAIDEPYLNEKADDLDFGPYYVPDEGVFVMGDNRNHSLDARYWNNTYVTYDTISGKALFAYWPKLDWLYASEKQAN